jgi:crotonobetainyl-CoA:carnitine CoA-transferase CaiB-like acyl-CoA transferase
MAALGVNYAAFRTINPRLVMCSLTPFGLTGLYKDYQTYELTGAHGGGWAWLSPGGSDIVGRALRANKWRVKRALPL